MLSDKSYAKFFGENLLEEIFHLDEELAQAVANKEDPLVEQELEHSLDVAISEAEEEATKILSEAKKKKPIKFHVYSAFGGAKLSSHPSEAEAHKAASKASHKQPVHIWTAEGGDLGMGKPVAHYHNGVKTVYEDFERGLDTMMEAEIGSLPEAIKRPKDYGKKCDCVGSHNTRADGGGRDLAHPKCKRCHGSGLVGMTPDEAADKYDHNPWQDD